MKLFNKYVSIVLCIVIVLSVFICCQFSTVSAEVITTMYIDGEGVNVRTGPGTNYTIIEKVSNRSATVLESTQNNDKTWYKISYYNGTETVTGYVAYDEKYIRIVTYDPDDDFETKLSAFPESYHKALKALHKEFPNWEFIPDPVNTSFTESVRKQTYIDYKQVQDIQPVSWRSMGPGAYDWWNDKWIPTNGGWYIASREIIAYYMDPRNFLDSNNIYMFLQQGFNENLQTEEGVRKIIKGTFMETNYYDPNDLTYGGDYAKVLMEAAKQSGVSPYILASKIRQEIGTNLEGKSPMVSGTYPGFEGYYNFYNFAASGDNTTEVIKNGLTFARDSGWNTRSKAIIEGASRYSGSYISVNQDTYYLQDFDIHSQKFYENGTPRLHQYAQAVHDACSKGAGLAKIYNSEKDYSLTFKIPVFPGMPDLPVQKPEESKKFNNYYIMDFEVKGLSPSFDKYIYEYSLKVSGDTAIKATPISNATLITPEKYSLVAGENTIVVPVQSWTGFINEYTIKVNADVDCNLYINTTGTFPEGVTPSPPQDNESQPDTEPVIMKGDTNGDGQITLRDLANVRLHLLKLLVLDGDNLTGADTDGDGTVALRDLANLRLHLLGLKSIG